jgi:hypothetical protein
MKAYVDSSIILRIIFAEKDILKLPKNISIFAASEILKVECFRTIDRMRHTLNIADDEIAERHAALHKTLRTLHLFKFTDAIIQRACQPFPITLKSLDAIHLSTAALWDQEENEDILFLTHDIQLGKAARALGFEVLGS